MSNNQNAITIIQHMYHWGGPHLKTVRSWMQGGFRNGSTVEWGSDEKLTGTDLTPKQLEHLAEQIKDALVQDIIRTLEETNE